MFEYDTLVGSSRVGPDQRLSLGAAVDYIQDCEWFDITGEPVAAAYFKEMGVGMVVIFRQLELFRRPHLAEKLRLKTWAYDCTRLLGFRNTVIYDEEGNVCVAGNSIGAFVSVENGRVERVEQRVADSIGKRERYGMDYLPRRIPIPQWAPVLAEPVRICRHHLDGNRHMNNARYLEIAEDSLEDKLFYNQLRVEYKIPAQLGDILIPEIYGQNREIVWDQSGEALLVKTREDLPGKSREDLFGKSGEAQIVRLRDKQGRENAVVEFRKQSIFPERSEDK